MLGNLENSAAAIRLKKVSFHSNPKECSNYHTTALILYVSKEMLKILQTRLKHTNRELPGIQLDLEKAEEPEIKFPTLTGSLKKEENSKKTSTSASLTMLKSFTVWFTTNCGQF